MESTDLQIVNSDQIEMAITENNNGYESRDDDIELQKFLFYSAQFHSDKNLESSSNNGVGKKPIEIEYYVKKLNKDIHEVSIKCPASDCEEILDIDSIMPIDFLIQVRDVNRLTEVLPSPLIIDFPFVDCIGKLIDDQRGYPIRACPECWKSFCVNCKSLHFGMTCENYQFSRQLNFLHWQQQYGGYRDELEEEEEEEGEEEEEKEEEGEGEGKEKEKKKKNNKNKKKKKKKKLHDQKLR
ncbi:hypothetical protein H5410_030142 [Solanum commersonii]|uniref:Uncharacterized protein n=1 Tax=Solanum commersonii TaxID=4109 RepID=A0A9J5YHS1_SOLCO|nr:hypothetical protein H5410_030142 [Solanum commersonii]